MPGICGVVHRHLDFRFDRARLRNMRDSMACRGPDGWGEFVSGRAVLAARRLALLDPSEQGNTPVTALNGRYAAVSDGAVLNYRSLSGCIDPLPPGFRTQTDTEVLLHFYARKGPAMLDSLNGAFALAIWDDAEGELFLARDRLGMKPLCYAERNGALYFASEEKALFAAGFAAEFDEAVWPELMLFRYVAGERTPYRGVARLLPGHYLVWKDGRVRTARWWNLGERARALRESLVPQPAEWLVETIDDAVRLCRTAVVPAGLLLSGGLGSATIAASLAAVGAVGLASFTARFAEPGCDDGNEAQAVAARCGLDSHELPLSAAEVIGLIEPATWLDDVPLAHGFEMPLLGVAEYANSRARVLLSGGGSDVIMGGCARYWPLRWPSLLSGSMLPRAMGLLWPNGPAGRLARWLALRPTHRLVLFNGCELLPPDLEMLGVGPCEFPYREQVLEEARRVYPDEPVRQAMYLDQHTYLPSVVDHTDRMTMGASVECRLPFLDHRLVEALAALPNPVLLAGRRARCLLRRALQGRLPEHVRTGRKWGAGIPWRRYLRNVTRLRRLVAALPSMEPVRSGPFAPPLIRSAADAFLRGDDRWEPLIRQLLMIGVWYQTSVRRKNLGSRAARAGGIYL
ncbi:MAG: asparagine synthase (glutamine-hydrolyzing) [Rhodospirillales bacterium]